MKSSKMMAILAASCVGVVNLSASAAPLLYYSVVGRITGTTASFGSTVTVSAGQSVDIRFVASFAPLGTAWLTYTLTSISSGDGLNNTPTVDVTRTNTNQIAGAFVPTIVVDNSDPDAFVTNTYAGTLATGWNQGIGFSPGEISSGDIQGVKAIRAPGTFVTSSTSLIAFRTTYAVTSVTGSASTLHMSSTSPVSGFWIHCNNKSVADGFISTSQTESGPNPLVGFFDLNLVAPAVPNNAPTFATGSGLSPGDTGIDATLDLIYPLNLQTHFKTFSIADSLITDEAASTTVVTLGPGALSGVNAPLAGHMSIIGRNIVISGSYLDVQNMLGTYAIPLMLTDSQGSSSNGTFALQIVPEPLETGLLGLGGLSLLRRRRRS